MLARAAWIAALALCLAAALPAASSAAPVSTHAELYTCCMSHAEKERRFQESRALGATYVRVSVEVPGIFASAGSAPDWHNLDDVMALSRRYGVRVLGIILNTPQWLSTCPSADDPDDCPPKDIPLYGSLAGKIAAHARGTIGEWQILNEPSLNWAFNGTPEQYGRILAATHDAIKRAAPEDRVVIGNTYVDAGEQAWAREVFAASGRGKFEIAAINLRSGFKHMSDSVKVWRRFLRGFGFNGPIWVTEHGYPAGSQYQFIPEFRGGPAAQAAYMKGSLRAIDAAGAGEVFVTLRHDDANRYQSEGIVNFGPGPAFAASYLPAFAVVRDWAKEWRRNQLLYRERASFFGKRAGLHRLAAAIALRRIKLLKQRAKRARRRELRYLRRARTLGTDHEDYATARRRANAARKSRRNSLRRAARFRRRAQTHRVAAAESARSERAYGALIKPLR